MLEHGGVSTSLSRFIQPIAHSKIGSFGSKMMKGLNKLDDVLSWIGDPKGSAIKYISSISSIDVKSTYYKKIYIEMAEGAIYGIHSSYGTVEIALKQNEYIKTFFSNNFCAIGNMFKQDTLDNLKKSITKTIIKLRLGVFLRVYLTVLKNINFGKEVYSCLNFIMKEIFKKILKNWINLKMF